MRKTFYGKYNGISRACASSVYQASPWGGVGNEVMILCVACVIRCDITCFIIQLEVCCLGNTTVQRRHSYVLHV